MVKLRSNRVVKGMVEPAVASGGRGVAPGANSGEMVEPQACQERERE